MSINAGLSESELFVSLGRPAPSARVSVQRARRFWQGGDDSLAEGCVTVFSTTLCWGFCCVGFLKVLNFCCK